MFNMWSLESDESSLPKAWGVKSGSPQERAQPTVRHYWNVRGFGNPFIQYLISLTTFERLSSSLRWPDPKETPSEEKVYELEKLINERIKLFWEPAGVTVVDEIMLLFKGRFKYRQHVRGKPKATGLKLFALADSNSYLWHFYLYRVAIVRRL